MRIIAGRFKGRKLQPPKGDAIRPTSDRMREAMFNLLMHGSYGGQHILEQRVMDLCCGTGALGLEALSRGAAECCFVDQDKTALQLARDNALHCGAMPLAQFIQSDVARLPTAREPVMLVMMDAPYATKLTLPAYNSLRGGGWLQSGSLFVVEQEKASAAETLDGAELIDQRHYGKAQLLIYRAT